MIVTAAKLGNEIVKIYVVHFGGATGRENKTSPSLTSKRHGEHAEL